MCSAGLAASLTLPAGRVLGQDALRYSSAGEAAAESTRLQLQNQPYTFKTGDLRVLLSPSIGFDWNDNVYLSKNNPQDDLIIRPALTIGASYPITQRNLFQINVTIGYSKYVNHGELSRLFVASGSGLSFDFYTGDFAFNVHDQVSYTQDSATEAAVSNTGNYGTLQNTAGISGTWDLQDVTLNLGYDHQNYYSTTSGFNQIDHSSEMVVSRAGLKLNPRLTAGLEGTFSYTAYDQRALNNSSAYSGGVYAQWRPGNYFTASPRIGYSIYDFQQTSLLTKAVNQDSWYADLTLTHAPTEFLSYSVSVGHELRLGILSDSITATYFRPSVTWNILKNVSLQTSVFYEHGTDNGGLIPGALRETYDWYGGGFNVAYSPARRISLSLNYRLTLRASDVVTDEYAQNLVSLIVTYRTL